MNTLRSQTVGDNPWPSDLQNFFSVFVILFIFAWFLRLLKRSYHLYELKLALQYNRIIRLDSLALRTGAQQLTTTPATPERQSFFERIVQVTRKITTPSTIRQFHAPLSFNRKSLALTRKVREEDLEKEKKAIDEHQEMEKEKEKEKKKQEIPVNERDSDDEGSEQQTLLEKGKPDFGNYGLKFELSCSAPTSVQLFWGVKRSQFDQLIYKTEATEKDEKENRESLEAIEEGRKKPSTRTSKGNTYELLEGDGSSELTPREEKENKTRGKDKSKQNKKGIKTEVELEEVCDSPSNHLMALTEFIDKSSKYQFTAGENQLFHLDEEDYLDISKNSSSSDFSLMYDPETSTRYPLVVVISSTSDLTMKEKEERGGLFSLGGSSGSTKKSNIYLVLLITFSPLSDENQRYRANLLSHFLLNSEFCHEIKELYGLAEESTSEDDEECVVCLCDDRNIIFVPCGHFCVCHSCLIKLDKCPICRCNIKSFLILKKDDEKEELSGLKIDVENNTSHKL